MKKRFRRFHAALALLLFLSTPALAQYEESRFSYGLSFGPGFKARIAERSALKYGLWGDFAIGMFVAYGGTNPNSMRARIHGQISRDDLYMRVGYNEAYILESVGVLLNPEVSIPLVNKYGESRTELLIGIGGQYSSAQSFGVHNVNGFFGGNFLDELADTFYNAQRPLVPFVTAGIGIKFHRRASLTIRLRQDMQNSFTGDRDVTMYSSTNTRTVKLSAIPTRLLIGFVIRLGRLPEMY